MREDDVDPTRFMTALSQAGVRWLLIGRQALIHYGVPVQTMDYDVWIDPAPANVTALLRVARELDLEAPGSAEDVEGQPYFSLLGGSVKIDVFKVRKFTNLDGKTIEFGSAYRRRVVAESEGDPLAPPLPSIGDLRTLKRMRDSEKDREDLRYLDLIESESEPGDDR